ncbi:hypothetical protein B566_EDAN012375 [Ephemera danica]|nr:hypothetical protein B566_EDAN012375 [Ephemera danica]
MFTMASKASKKSAAPAPTAATPVQTPAASTSASSGRSRSPLSPTRYNRLQEKAELQNLNDRLAVYIDRVRQLETENSRLSREIQSYQEVSTREVTSIKSMYEQELVDARNMLNETSKEKAKMEIDMKRMWEENEDLQNRLDKKTKDCAGYEKSSSMFESRYNDISGKYNQAQADRKKAQDELKEREKELEKLRNTLDTLRKQMEEEMLSRVEVENRLQTAREELNLKEQMYNQEIKEVTTRRQVEISELDNRLVEEYNAKLQLSLQELREQYEAQMRANRDDIEVLYENKMREMKNQMTKNSGAADQAIQEMRQYKLQLDSVAGKIASLEAAKSSLTCRVEELERILEMEREQFTQDLARADAESQRLREEMAAQLNEYQDLMDIKVALDLEIAAYQKLLESEEARLNITPMQSPGVQRYTPVRRTPLRGIKRPRTVMESSEEHFRDEFETKKSASGDIEISEACPQGRFVKLHNKGSKEAALGGWLLLRKAGEKETIFKFHRTVKVDPGTTITVWSSDQGQAHEPPTNIVMKGQKWFEMATLEQQRVRLASSRRSPRSRRALQHCVSTPVESGFLLHLWPVAGVRRFGK